jgi:predicted nuclease of predicted toxin-antitoxin system
VKFWVDAQLPPKLAAWLAAEFEVEAVSLRDLGLRDAEDAEIFEKAKLSSVVIISKDSDFVDMVSRYGTPPQLLWVTCGNVTNHRLQEVFRNAGGAAINCSKSGRQLLKFVEAGSPCFPVFIGCGCSGLGLVR